MTYHTCKCPYCKNVVNRAKGNPSYIGNPFRKCPFCKATYVDTFTEEWITKSPLKRFKFLIEIPLSVAFFVFIIIGGLFTMSGSVLAGLILGILCAALAFGICFISKRGETEADIQESLNRTKKESYVKMLKQAGFTIYSIKGVAVGTIKDKNNSEELENEEIKRQKNRTISWH